ncbi:MAG: hypothetical protein ACXWQR_19585 [Ktedonobacterales bacterium]
MAGRAFRVGVSGHRVLGGSRVEEAVRAQCREVLACAKNEHGRMSAISAIATGADSIFAEVALELGIPLRVVIPFRGYASDFETQAERKRFEELLGRTVSVRHLPYTRRSDRAYLAGGIWVAAHADLLVAVWDRQPARGLGGTADIVAYAQEHGTPVRVIEVKRHA